VIVEQYLNKLQDMIVTYNPESKEAVTGGLFYGYQMKNNSTSEKLCKNLFNSAFNVLCKNLENKIYKSFEEYKVASEEVMVNFEKSAKGPAAPVIKEDGLIQLHALDKQQMLTFQLNDAQTKIAEQKAEVAEVQAKLEKQHEEVRKWREELETAQAQHTRELHDMAAKKRTGTARID